VLRDELVFLCLVGAFAALATAHVALVAGLATRKPAWRGLVALAIPPLAPYWGARSGLHKRVVLWVGCAAAYVVMRIVAR
jgi:hypothetical protein